MLLPTYYIGEVGKLLGAKWKELDEEEKKVYFHPSALCTQRLILYALLALHRASYP